MPVTLLLSALTLLPVPGQDTRALGRTPAKPYLVGNRVGTPIRLPDLDGDMLELVAERPESVTVLVFWSLRDPIARGYLPRLEELRAEFAGKGVLFFLVNSNHDELVSARSDPLDKLRAFVKDQKVHIPIVVDRENVLADDFTALCANHAFVIGANRRLLYSGAIDDDPKGRLRELDREVRTWLRDGIEAALAGGSPAERTTRPSGRPIKRWPKEGAKER